MAGSVKVSGTWRNLKKAHVRVDGTWREVSQAWTRVGGVWRKWFSSSSIELIVQLDGQSGTTYDLTNIPQNYSHLLIQMSAEYVNVTGGNTPTIQIALSDNAPANYVFDDLRAVSPGSILNNTSSSTFTTSIRHFPQAGPATTDVWNGELWLPFYSLADNSARIVMNAGSNNGTTTHSGRLMAHTQTREAINRITFTQFGGTTTNMDIRIYGVI